MSWEQIARRQHGTVTRRQLLDAGLSERVIDGLITRGEVTRQLSGIYLVRGAPETYLSTLWTAVLATDGVLGHNTACHHWDVIDERTMPLTILVPVERRVQAPRGVRVRRRTGPIPRTIHRGLPVTPRSESILDLLGDLSRPQGATLLDRSLQQNWLSDRDVLRRLESPHRGNVRLRQLARVLGDGAEAESERMLHRLLRQAGVHGWRPNVTVQVRGRRYRLDVALEESLIAIEIDGMAWHLDAVRKQRDLHRQNDLVGAGWTVLRFTWNDLMYRPEYVVSRIREAAGETRRRISHR